MYEMTEIFFDQKYDFYWSVIKNGNYYNIQGFKRWLNGLLELCGVVRDYALFKNCYKYFFNSFSEEDINKKFNKVKKDIIKLLNDEINVYEGMVNLHNSLENFRYSVNDVK